MARTGRVGPLATERQLEIERMALALFDSAAVKAARERTLAYFLDDRNAALPDQDDLLRQSVDAHHFHAALMAASEAPGDPTFVWAVAGPHAWHGLEVRDSRFGQDNSDNCYRLAAIDPALRYRVAGRLGSGGWPSDFSISALVGQLGENILADTVALITPATIDVDDQGRFAIEVDESPTDGRRNHLPIAGAKLLFVRDTLGDWQTELPCELEIECLSDNADTAFDEVAAELRAADLGETMARFMLETLQHGIFERGELNSLNPPWAAGDHGGLATQASSLGHYRLGQDEALIISAERHNARYMGMQITDIWMLSYDYWDRTSSLNHSQVETDEDGRVRWVISAGDPGVWNWLDSGGHRHGTILLRWQHLPPGVVPTVEDISVKLVLLEELRRHLPDSTRAIDADERAAQRVKRRADYERRLTGD